MSAARRSRRETASVVEVVRSDSAAMPTFDRASLSPRLVDAEPMDLPFGLTLHELAPALPGLARDRLAECVVTRRYALQGLRDRARSTPMTVRYAAADGFDTVDLFVKRTPAAAPEGEWYRLLAANDVPVPALLAEIPREDGDVVVVVELLELIGIDFDDSAEVTELLRLLARLNAIPDRAPHESPPSPKGLPEVQFTAMVRDALDALRVMEPFEDLGIVVPTWLGAYVATNRICATLPTALTHGEMYFQHVGRRRGGDLVLFDLATVGVRPRLSDLCSIVSVLAEQLAVDERDVLGRYLDETAALGAPVPAVDVAYEELRLLRIHSAYQSLPWLVSAHTDPDIGFEMLAHSVATLRRDLFELGVLA